MVRPIVNLTGLKAVNDYDLFKETIEVDQGGGGELRAEWAAHSTDGHRPVAGYKFTSVCHDP